MSQIPGDTAPDSLELFEATTCKIEPRYTDFPGRWHATSVHFRAPKTRSSLQSSSSAVPVQSQTSKNDENADAMQADEEAFSKLTGPECEYEWTNLDGRIVGRQMKANREDRWVSYQAISTARTGDVDAWIVVPCCPFNPPKTKSLNFAGDGSEVLAYNSAQAAEVDTDYGPCPVPYLVKMHKSENPDWIAEAYTARSEAETDGLMSPYRSFVPKNTATSSGSTRSQN